MIIRDHFNADFSLFVPWQLGSQSCEKVFRSARSMSNIFSTVINFSLLGLLRRLHRLQIQSNLQAQSEVTGIAYPQVHKHESKDGTNSFISYSIDSISNTAIGEAVSLAHIAAKASIDSLGMDALLNEYEQSSNLPVPDTDTLSDCDADVDSDLDTDEEVEDPSDALVESSIECASDIEKDIAALTSSDLIDSGVKQKLTSFKQSFPQFKRSSNSTIPIYTLSQDITDEKMVISPFLEVKHENYSIFIRKTTVLWLLQESERVSNDRLFRIREKKPFSSESTKFEKQTRKQEDTLPEISSDVKLGEIGVFMRNGKLKIGKILQFSKFKNKSVSGRQFKESTARISSDIGVVCSWFELMSGSENVFQLCSENDKQNTVHYYIPLSDYVCTLTSKCIQTKDKEGNSNTSIMHIAANQKVMMTMDCLRLTDSCKKYISNAVPKKCFDVGSSSCSGSVIWTTIDKTNLYESDRLALLGKTEYLNDNHMLCALILLKQAFPELGGLESTLRQQKGLTPLPDRPSLQILHINDNHWVVASTIDCPPEANILLYDSLYTTINNQTKLLLAELVHSTKSTFTVGLANVKKQSGSKDCGLFSVAFVTDIHSKK